jgi:hypothetical protein
LGEILQTQLDDERRQREEMEKMMAKMFQYMQSLGTAFGFAPPPLLFPTANPTQFHTPVSIKIQVLDDIHSSSLTHAIPFLCRDNQWH